MISEMPDVDVDGPAKILAVDDTPANLEMLAMMLKVRGYDVRAVDGGNQALLEAKSNPPDLILLDIAMPGMDGYEVCHQLKADAELKGIPVIFISALSEPLDKVKAFAMGGVDYLTKPYQMDELHARVETHLQLRGLQIQLERKNRDLELAQERFRLDLQLAREVQRGFLPRQLPEVPGYEFFANYESALEVGGDYYDFIQLPGERIAVMLGDVAGKGVAAALLMAKLSADARFCMVEELDSAQAFNRLNSMTGQSGVDGGRLVTLVAAILAPLQHTVTLVNAGHPVPLLYNRTTRTVKEAVDDSDTIGVPLGVLDDFSYSSCQITLAPGDSILAFTDGVIEAMNDRDVQMQTKGVYAAMQCGNYSARELGGQVINAVKQFTTGRSQHDDIAVVGFGRIG